VADWCRSARSNYFRVKDPEAFKERADSVPDLAAEQETEGKDKGNFMLWSADEYGGWPTGRYNEETEDYEDYDLASELSEHLAEGEVAVLLEIGAEKLRYLSGFAVAVDSRGHRAEACRWRISRTWRRDSSKLRRARSAAPRTEELNMTGMRYHWDRQRSALAPLPESHVHGPRSLAAPAHRADSTRPSRARVEP